MERPTTLSFLAAAILFACAASGPAHAAGDATCGNGRLNQGEGCDDGNVSAGDGCAGNCLTEMGWRCTRTSPSVCTNQGVCSNGVIEAGEACDDGNLTLGDGCQPDCTVQAGYSCTGEPSVCLPPGNLPTGECGDGVVDDDENCDDGDDVPGDGCDDECQIESGFECAGEPSVCTETDCGNGTVDAGEDCDGGPCCVECSFATSTRTCRAAVGGCDAAETCNGSSADCPADTRKPGNTVCRPAVSEACDVAETCNGSTATCPDDQLLGCPDSDPTDCVHPVCEAAGQCSTVNECAAVCRDARFWATRATSGQDRTSAIELVLEQTGPIEVCGQTIDNGDDLGDLDSALEGLCVRPEGDEQRELYRALLATTLNCLLSEGECDDILSRFTDVSYEDCNALCEGDTVPGGPTIDQCIDQLECFNKGGQVIDGDCATGTCESDPEQLCGGDFGSCPGSDEDDDDGEEDEEECVAFDDNCADRRLCQNSDAEARLCGRRLVPRNQKVCRDARNNQCTIDECN
jgi:cysteine-rich repeat protein